MGQTKKMRIARAEASLDENLKAILGLIDESKSWLPTKDTDQWAKPWPIRKQRDESTRRGLKGGKTWVVSGGTPAATVTVAERQYPQVWTDCERDLGARAVFMHRLITARKYAGRGLGGRADRPGGTLGVPRRGSRAD